MMPHGVNSKDAVSLAKPGLRHVPIGPLYAVGQAMDDGARKYGAFSWRAAPVVASVYRDACQRHLDRWFDGADRAEDSGVPHLAHAAANLLILLDAVQQGCLEDDRPRPRVSLDRIFEDFENGVDPLIDRADRGFEIEAPGAVCAAPEAAPASVVADTVPAVSVAAGPVTPAPWSDADLDRLRDLRGRGLSWADIGREFGRSAGACRLRFGKLQAKVVRKVAPASKRVVAPAVVDAASGAAVSAPHRPVASGVSPRKIGRLCGHLDRLPVVEGVDAAVDLRIGHDLLVGRSARDIGHELGLPSDFVIERFRMMVPAWCRDPRGAISIEGRDLLIAALTRNAEAG